MPATALSPSLRRTLRAKAHHVNPTVAISGNGLSPAVLKEIDTSLKAHELVKIRVFSDDRDERNEFMSRICSELGCDAVQHIGKILVVFRPRPDEPAPAPREPRKPAAKATALRPASASPRIGSGRNTGLRAPKPSPLANRSSAFSPKRPAVRRRRSP